MTAMVSSPRRMRASDQRMASTGFRMRMSSPSVSCRGRQARTLAMISASCARASSSQNTAGAPDARARPTASRTQSRTGSSFVWHMRKMSPTLTGCSISTPPPAATTRIVPAPDAVKVLSCEPYSSALRAISPTFDTLPMVAGSNCPCRRQSSMIAWYTAA